MNSLTDDFVAAHPARIEHHYPSLETEYVVAGWNRRCVVDKVGHYAYATNMPQLGECLVGNMLMKPATESLIDRNGKRAPKTREALASLLKRDGLYYLGDVLPETGHVIAFFEVPESAVYPSELICARRDSNDIWSALFRTPKGGCDKPYCLRQVDLSRNVMHDIRRVNMGPHTQFLGFGSIPYKGVSYYSRLSLQPAEMAYFSLNPPAIAASRPQTFVAP